MNGFISDHDIEGHFLRLMQLVRQSRLVDEWNSLELESLTFSDIGWSIVLPDSEVWRLCQERQLILVTNNRNREDETSLEATIRSCSNEQSFPVVTIGSIDRFKNERDYAERLAEELIELAFDLIGSGQWLGSGRIFLPRQGSSL